MEREEAVRLLRDLVAVPSPSGEEGEAQELFLRRLAMQGFRTWRDEAGNGFAAVGQGEAEALLLGHIDTVPGWPPVKLLDGFLYGRGTVDAKGPLCALAAAAARATRAGSPWRLVVCAAVQEETPGSRGAHAVAAAWRPRFAVVGEPSGWEGITLGYKGRADLQALFRADHHHRAGLARTAAEEGVRFWQWLEDRTGGREGGDTFHRLLATLEHFETKHLSLAEEARLRVSLRLPPDFAPEAFLAEVRARFPAGRFSLDHVEPAFRVPRRGPLVAAFRRAIRTAGGRPRLLLKTGTADMNVVGPRWGVPLVAYGPGDSRLDHTPGERISVEEFWRAVEVLTAVFTDPLLVRALR